MSNELRVGNLDSRRDWGYAPDYVEAMWLMLQQDEPEDFVIATGRTHSIERLLDVAFNCVDLEWKDYTVQDPKFMRPAEVDLLIGDPAKAQAKLGWEPSISFEEMIQIMVEADIQRLKKDADYVV
jgi:GDPmannose 4,6-dehydratase